ncbi:MAG: type II toxin-antitoxin system RelE/ParE family toxin [Sphingomonadaceae bacterium]
MTDRIAVAESSAYLKWAEGRLSDLDRMHIIDVISENPEAGVVIRGSGGLRKARIALPGRGKSGGGRVIYWFYTENFPVVLLFAFAKNEADTVSDKQLKAFRALGEGLIEDFGGAG